MLFNTLRTIRTLIKKITAFALKIYKEDCKYCSETLSSNRFKIELLIYHILNCLLKI